MRNKEIRKKPRYRRCIEVKNRSFTDRAYQLKFYGDMIEDGFALATASER